MTCEGVLFKKNAGWTQALWRDVVAYGAKIKARMTCSGLIGRLVPLNGFVTKLRKLIVLSDESVNGSPTADARITLAKLRKPLLTVGPEPTFGSSDHAVKSEPPPSESSVVCGHRCTCWGQDLVRPIDCLAQVQKISHNK